MDRHLEHPVPGTLLEGCTEGDCGSLAETLMPHGWGGSWKASWRKWPLD